MFTTKVPPPAKITRAPRLDAKLKNMKRGQSVVLDERTAMALCSHFRYHGREHRRKRVAADTFRVWAL
jgi:hypothetical protein